MTPQRKAGPKPLVSVILVNWNRVQDITENIHTLRKQTCGPVEIVVVDNGSSDDSVARLRDIPDVILIELPENMGPASARNAAFERVTGEFTLLLDSDSFLVRTGLQRLITRMQQDPAIAVIGCRVLNWFSGDIDQWFYARPYDEWGDREFDTYSFSAAGALLRTEVVRRIGGFWDELFIYNEEVELSIRMIQQGYRILYSPEAPVFHRSSPLGRVSTSRYFYHQIRNWIWILYRHYPPLSRTRLVSLMCLVYLVKGARGRQLAACLQGMVAGLCGIRWIKKYRPKLTAAQVQKLARLNPRSRIRADVRASEGKRRPTTVLTPPLCRD